MNENPRRMKLQWQHISNLNVLANLISIKLPSNILVWNIFQDPRRYLIPFIFLSFLPNLVIEPFPVCFDPHYLLKSKSLAKSQPYSFTSNLKIVLKKEIGLCRSSFGPFFKWEIIVPYHFLLKNFYLKYYTCVHLLNTTIIEISWNIPFLTLLHWIICSENKNLWKTSQEVSSSIHLT